MAGWHHRLDGREFEWTPGVGDGQGGLACCSSWGHKQPDTTERLNWTEVNIICNLLLLIYMFFLLQIFLYLNFHHSPHDHCFSPKFLLRSLVAYWFPRNFYLLCVCVRACACLCMCVCAQLCLTLCDPTVLVLNFQMFRNSSRANEGTQSYQILLDSLTWKENWPAPHLYFCLCAIPSPQLSFRLQYN